jgi:hypothetical protein
MAGHYSPQLPNWGKNNNLIKNFAIIWRLIGGNNLKFAIYWDKTRNIIYSNYDLLG